MATIIRIRDHTFLSDGLDAAAVVIDAGAHRGNFSRQLFERFGCRSYAIEANPQLARSLDRRFVRAVLEGALAANAGKAVLNLQDNLEASSILSRGATGGATVEIQSFTLAEILHRYALPRVDLLKLDIEGAEYELLDSLDGRTLSRVVQITAELHDIDGRGVSKTYARLSRRLSTFGFVGFVMSFRGYGDVLFVNRKLMPVGRSEAIYLRTVGKLALRLRHLLPVRRC